MYDDCPVQQLALRVGEWDTGITKCAKKNRRVGKAMCRLLSIHLKFSHFDFLIEITKNLNVSHCDCLGECVNLIKMAKQLLTIYFNQKRPFNILFILLKIQMCTHYTVYDVA